MEAVVRRARNIFGPHAYAMELAGQVYLLLRIPLDAMRDKAVIVLGKGATPDAALADAVR